MEWNTTIYINPNVPEHSIFKKSITLGRSSYSDKWHTELIGEIENNNVYEWHTSFNEDTEEVREEKVLISEHTSFDDAFNTAKTIFNITDVYTYKQICINNSSKEEITNALSYRCA